MIIKGNVPRMLSTAHKGSHYIRYTKDGRMIAAKWPRKRGRKIAPITQQQVLRWDKAILWARTPEPWAFRLALEATTGNAFYARDIILMETYGNYVSWPGWGRYPNGPVGGEVLYPPGTLKSVDAVVSVDSYRNSGTLTVMMELWEPSDARLYVSTIAPQLALSKIERQGVAVPHGQKVWMAEALLEAVPVEGDGTDTQKWEVADPDPTAATIWWWVALKGASSPVVEWQSAVYPQDGTGPPPSSSWYAWSPGQIAGPHGFTPPAGDVAYLNGLQDDEIACLQAHYGAVITQDHRAVLFEFCDGGGPDLTGSSVVPDPFIVCDGAGVFIRVWPAEPTGQACFSPDPLGDAYNWWIVFTAPGF